MASSLRVSQNKLFSRSIPFDYLSTLYIFLVAFGCLITINEGVTNMITTRWLTCLRHHTFMYPK